MDSFFEILYSKLIRLKSIGQNTIQNYQNLKLYKMDIKSDDKNTPVIT